MDQNVDTSTSTVRLMFDMLASIAEFEMTYVLNDKRKGSPK
ncbi:hypothetical protein ACUMO5_000434 [Vibrio parahaemolyticus]|nr:hypothetical protein [Vibrio parahaemolyticus]